MGEWALLMGDFTALKKTFGCCGKCVRKQAGIHCIHIPYFHE